MSGTEIRRRRTDDPEMDALAVIDQVMEPLDERARNRVLEWASAKFVEDPKRAIGEQAFEAMKRQMDAINDRAQFLGVTDRQLIHAMSALREREGLAPVEVRESIERAEAELAEKSSP